MGKSWICVHICVWMTFRPRGVSVCVCVVGVFRSLELKLSNNRQNYRHLALKYIKFPLVYRWTNDIEKLASDKLEQEQNRRAGGRWVGAEARA